ncbi:Aste57867_6121 [Aphanomyces stellatus]|uniref:Aste57867_6121 protein n=1 Tax=Aphanomyces stellatus TaxID=120398 RepID=A0A485KHG8_9STRA|nr:hypothetical protein As57867_006107 [Aphanomyces stellatus]VFT83128.1 Aste57867_6121 [Aphanomyces stellatus]
MLANFIGLDKFYVGMHNYLTQYAYNNAKTVDLWQALEAASGLKITAMAHTWTTQMGFPVVTVTKNGEKLWLTQERFLSNGTKDTESKWDVPVTFRTPAGVTNAGIWKADVATFELDAPTTSIGWELAIASFFMAVHMVMSNHCISKMKQPVAKVSRPNSTPFKNLMCHLQRRLVFVFGARPSSVGLTTQSSQKVTSFSFEHSPPERVCLITRYPKYLISHQKCDWSWRCVLIVWRSVFSMNRD